MCFAVLLSAVAHSPPARRLVASRLVAIAATHGIALRIDALRYNLFVGRVEAEGVALAPSDTPTTPWFTVDRATVVAGWRTLITRSHLDAVTLVRPRVAWPPGPADAADTAASREVDWASWSIGSLVVDDLSLVFAQLDPDVGVDVAGVSLVMQARPTGLAGRLGATTIGVRLGDATLWQAREVAGNVSLLGAVATLNDVRARVGESALALAGEVALDDRADGLLLDATLAGELAGWLQPFVPDVDVGGHATLTARVSGSVSSPEVDARLTSESLRVGPFESAVIAVPIRVSHGDVAIEGATLRGPRERVDASIVWPAAGGLSGSAEWSGLDVNRVAAWLALDLPVRVAASSGGRAEVASAWPVDVDTLVGRLTHDVEPSTGTGLRLAGTTAFEIERGRWRARGRHDVDALRVETAASGSVAWPVASASFEGEWEATSDRPAQVIDALAAAGLDLVEREHWDVEGPLRASGRLSGTVGAPRADGTATLAALVVGPLPPVLATAALAVTPDGLALRDTELRADTWQVVGTLDVPFDDDPWVVAVDGSIDAATIVASVVPEGGALVEGRLAVRGSARGQGNDLAWVLDVNGAQSRIPPFAPGALSARLEGDGDRITAREFALVTAEGRLDGSGTVHTVTGQFDAAIVTSGLTFSPTPEAPVPLDRLRGRVAGRLVIGGTMASPEISGRVAVDDAWVLDHALGTMMMDITSTGDGIEVALAAPSLATHATVHLDTRAPYTFDLIVDTSDGAIASWLPIVRPEWAHADIEVKLSARASIGGTLGNTTISRASIVVDHLEGRAGSWPVAIAAPTRVDILGPKAGTSGATLTVGDVRVDAAGWLTSAPDALPFHVTARGPIETLVGVAALFDGDMAREVDVRKGAFDADVVAVGPLSDIQVVGRTAITDGDISVAGERFDALDIEARIDGTSMVIESATAGWRGATATAHGHWPLAWLVESDDTASAADGGSARLDARLTGSLVEATAADAWWWPQRVDVQLGVDVSAPRADAISGELLVEALELGRTGIAIAVQPQTRVVLRAGTLHADDVRLRTPGGTLTATGEASLGPSGLDTADLTVKGRVDLAPVGAAMSMALAGDIDVDLAVRAEAGTPRVSGTIDLDDVALGLARQAVFFDGMTGSIRLTDESIVVDKLAGTLNGGVAAVDGTLTRINERWDGALLVTARDVVVKSIEGLRSEVAADLTLSLPPKGARLDGQVFVLPGAFRQPINMIQGLAEFTRLAARTGAPAGVRLPDAALALDVRFIEPLVVDHSFARLEVEADGLRLVGTLTDPVPLGRLAVGTGGMVALGGRTYRVRTGVVDFVDSQAIDPRLNLTIDTRVGQFDVTMRLTGTSDTLETRLSSEPPLPEADLRSLIATGRVAGLGRESDADEQDQFVRGLSSDLFGLATSVLGLPSITLGSPEFDLASDEVDPQTRITVTSGLGREIEVVYSQSLEGGEIAWMMTWRPRVAGRFDVRVVSRDGEERAIQVRQALELGGSRREITRRAAIVRPMVRAVTFTGDVPDGGRDLARGLRLRPGRQFDPYDWQRDRDRVVEHYRRLGFARARVVARRRDVDQPEPGLALEYGVRRGPNTVLEIEGTPVSPKTRARLLETWGELGPTPLLERAARDLVARELARSGFLASTVAVDRRMSDEVDILRLRIDAGAVVVSRRIDIEGARGIARRDLLTFIRGDVAEDEAWTDPSSVARALEARYVAAGFLEARVRAGPVIVDERLARLPIAIDEGPRFVVGTVRVDGGPDDVGLDLTRWTDTPFGVDVPSRVRRTVLDAHASSGFTSATAIVHTSIREADAVVDLNVNVVAGPRVMIEGVDVRGLHATRASVIEAALAVEPGAPASPARAAATQAHLYELGVFRTVDVDFVPTGDRFDGERFVVADVRVEEFPRYLMRYGVEYAEHYGESGLTGTTGPGAFVEWRDRNLFGLGVSGAITGRVETGRQRASALVASRRTFRRPLATTLSTDLDRQTLGSNAFRFDFRTANLNASQRWSPTRHMEVSWGLQATTFDIDVRLDDTTDRFSLASRFVGPTGTIVVDTRDGVLDATRGLLHSSNLRTGLTALGADATFVRYYGQQFVFVPLGPVVSASGVRFGAIRAGGEESILTFGLRFDVGGAHTVRGYTPEDMSATGSGLRALQFGGTHMLVLNQELRFPIIGWLGGVAFVDAGRSGARVSDLAIGDLAVSTGFGLRLRTPIALVRVDVGMPVDRRPGMPRARWYFGIGQAF